MTQLTVELTERQEHFLKEFATKHCRGAKDNLGTDRPIHLVQTRRERVIDDNYTVADKVIWVVPDWGIDYDDPHELVETFYERRDCPIPIVSYAISRQQSTFIGVDAEEHYIFNETDYFTAYGIEETFYERVAMEYYFDTVAYFFILDEARRYMQYQAHNLNHPRTYTVSGGYSNNGDYFDFWELLFKMGCQLKEA